MKPRIEKKVGKKIAEIIGNKLGKIWIDDEYCLLPPVYSKRGEKLSGNHERLNRNTRVCVNHMPVIGGGPDYFGEYYDPDTVVCVARNVFEWAFFSLGIEDECGRRGYPEVTERMTGAWLIKKARDYKSIKDNK